MARIVIVEDRLENALNLVSQFKKLAAGRQELDIQVEICLFYEDYKEREEKEKIIDESVKAGVMCEVRLVSLYDFDEVLDEYMVNPPTPTIAIMDFLLESATDSGARGIPMRRVNVRYARRAEEDVLNRIWFYTTSGEGNIGILEELFGSEHVLRAEMQEGRLHLQLNEFLLTQLQDYEEKIQIG